MSSSNKGLVVLYGLIILIVIACFTFVPRLASKESPSLQEQQRIRAITAELRAAQPGDIVEFGNSRFSQFYRVYMNYPDGKEIEMNLQLPGQPSGRIYVNAENVKHVYHRYPEAQPSQMNDWLMAAEQYTLQGLPREVAQK